MKALMVDLGVMVGGGVGMAAAMMMSTMDALGGAGYGICFASLIWRTHCYSQLEAQSAQLTVRWYDWS